MTSRVAIYSFGLKGGPRPPLKGSQQLDCRVLPNPWSDPNLRAMTGRNPRIKEFLEPDLLFEKLVGDAIRVATETGAVSFYCVGGKHRSVCLAEVTAGRFREAGWKVDLKHLAL